MSPLTPKPLGNALRLEVQADPLPGALTNMVANPSGALGGWGWVTPVPGSTLIGFLNAGQRTLGYTAPGGVASYLYTENMPVTAGQFVAASWTMIDAELYYRASIEWLNAAGTVLSAATQTGYLQESANAQSYGPFQAPASTAYCRLRFDQYLNTSGAAPTAGYDLWFRMVTVAKAAAAAALGTTYTNLVPNPSFETDTSSWTPSGSVSLVRDSVQHQDGVGSLHVVNTNTVVRTNLLTNPSVETNLTGWVADTTVSTLTRSTTGGTHGTATMRVAGGAGAGNPISTLLSTQSIPITTGQLIRVRADVNIGTTWDPGVQVYLAVRWYDSATHLMEDVFYGVDYLGKPTRSVWHTMDGTIKAKAGATHCRVAVYLFNSTATTASDVFVVDSVMVEKVPDSSLTGGYIDGTLPVAGLVSYAWTGTAHASASTETTKLVSTANPGAVTASFAITGGQYYTGSFYARSGLVGTGKRVSLTFTWLDASNAVLATNTTQFGTTAASWARYSASASAPSGATKLQLVVSSGAGRQRR